MLHDVDTLAKLQNGSKRNSCCCCLYILDEADPVFQLGGLSLKLNNKALSAAF